MTTHPPGRERAHYETRSPLSLPDGRIVCCGSTHVAWPAKSGDTCSVCFTEVTRWMALDAESGHVGHYECVLGDQSHQLIQPNAMSPWRLTPWA